MAKVVKQYLKDTTFVGICCCLFKNTIVHLWHENLNVIAADRMFLFFLSMAIEDTLVTCEW